MSANPHANGGLLLRDLRLPDFRGYAVEVPAPGAAAASQPGYSGGWLRDVIAANQSNFRLFGPDETASNRLTRCSRSPSAPGKRRDPRRRRPLARRAGSWRCCREHLCQGWLEGYLLTGRHGIFSCYEAFIHIIDSMFNQHAKWLKVARDLPWRRPIASLNYLLTSHVWRQDHNGFSHQDPGFIDHVVNKKAEIIRVYLPPDANTLLSIADHCLRSRHYVNVIVAGKQPAPAVARPWTRRSSTAPAASASGSGRATTPATEPDVVHGLRRGRADPGDAGRRRPAPPAPSRTCKVRVVNVVDLMRLQPRASTRTGCRTGVRRALHPDRPVIFAFHGYPWLIHRLTYRRTNHANLHVRGYKEEGTTTTPFDMVMLNDWTATTWSWT